MASTRDDMMICIGPAAAIRDQARRVAQALESAREHATSSNFDHLEACRREIEDAAARFEWLHKALRGECGPPPQPKRPRLTAAQQRVIEATARVLIDHAGAAQHAEPSDTLQ